MAAAAVSGHPGNNAGNCLISWTENITLDTGYTNLVGLIGDSDNALYECPLRLRARAQENDPGSAGRKHRRRSLHLWILLV
jgi:hypothetical protein